MYYGAFGCGILAVLVCVALFLLLRLVVVVIGVACRCFVYFVEFVVVFNSVGCDYLPYCLFSLVLVSCAICYDFCLFVCGYWFCLLVVCSVGFWVFVFDYACCGMVAVLGCLVCVWWVDLFGVLVVI